jgi:ABC-type phosphate transport system substrate-binding protein
MKFFTRAVAVLVFGFAALAQAEMAVIVNPAAAKEPSRAEVINIFLGRDKSFTALDLQQWSGAKDMFYSQVMNKTESQMTSYWSGLIFTGKGQPPQSVADDAAMVSSVAADTNRIGYVSADAVTDQVKVLFTLP